MKNIFTFLFCILSISNVIAQEKPQIVPGNIIVQVPSGQVDKVISENQSFNGVPTNLKLKKLLSAPMAAYLLEFNENIHHEQFLQQLWEDDQVTLIQLNHYIEDRNTTPNDPQLDQQWWHVNDGSSGTADSDIDSDEAWDITTGGVTAVGDTIVVCVVDNGGDLDHPDLMANNWVNHHEIPNNNIDDDGNGYVDDYLGWNPVDENDDVDGGSHGVNVAGMIGAVGNNGTGVVGVNWNVKIMNTTYGGIGGVSNPNEANVIEAYTYPLVMRRLYEQTGGVKGAFVVATNSSWGINNADPLDAPLWCAFYDTLGAAGILSAGATANNDVNIDNVGDLPTGCSSEYLISVTATNNEDVRTFSGYGATTVDLGAPGEDVRTTSAGGNYTTTSGTSFATPATAGAVGLMYSAPCASLAAIAHADPSLAAEMVRDAIFNGVDPISNLTTECVTGGRLNLKGSLDEILNNCSSGDCLPPFSLAASNVIDTTAEISWNALASIDSFNVSYGVVGGAITTVFNVTETEYNLENLVACSDYWFTTQSICDGQPGDWTDTLFFSTDGCCEAPQTLVLSGATDSSFTATWSSVLAADSYELSWRELGAGSWNNINGIDTTELVLAMLEPCTDYQVRVATNCDGGTTDYTATHILRTTGCGACTDNTYCESSGSTDFEWIGEVNVADLSNTTGASSSGYEDYTDMSVDLHRGSTYPISLSPDFDNNSYTEHFRIWIDLNQDGVFSGAEKVFDDNQGSQSTVSDSVTIPMNALLGSTRMRVSMAYGSQFGGDYPQTPCDDGQDGEVEDYCVNILEEDTLTDGIMENAGLFGMKVHPVPAMDFVDVQFESPIHQNAELLFFDAMGSMVKKGWFDRTKARLGIADIAPGVYMILSVGLDRKIIGRARLVKL